MTIRFHSTYLLLLSFLISTTACEEVVENPQLLTASPQLVIDAHLSDQVGQSKIILSQTDSYQAPAPTPRVSGALVSIRDQTGGIFPFIESANGHYLPQDSNFKGQHGFRYTLTVSMGDELYTATETLLPVPHIDSLTYEEITGDLILDDGYYVSLHIQEPGDTENYYLWRFLVNGELPEDDGEFDIGDDIGINGEQINLAITETLQPYDTFQISLFSLSEPAYRYYLGLLQLTDIGTPSQAVPENPASNLSGGALGFFQASSLTADTIIIIPED